ncbi:MAG: YihA family ribosome biogenesis GTP-binding protein [Ignavibacteriaceae bacterium]|nr:YihA family ribosome biogenesis GTP-binding protein [Ignavibacteriaceae bacterium]
MFSSITFIGSFTSVDSLPKETLPAIVLCGRSNVGKSSFINSFFNRRSIAKVSQTPGKTRTINYYTVENRFFVVDLPGYGYAKASKKDVEAWQKLIDEYFSAAGNIKLVFHLVDSRIPPTGDDILLSEYLQAREIPRSVLLTKTDKLNQTEYSVSLKKITEAFKDLTVNVNLFPFSIKKAISREKIYKQILKVIKA